MFPSFEISAYQVVPVTPVVPVAPSVTSWSSILMLVAFAVALPLGVKAMEWFFDIEPFNRVANALTKIGFAVLFLSCLASAVALPFSVMRRAETPGGVWTLLIIYVKPRV